uniref:Genome polyprotein n=1 Tax=Wild potato mosaic virus TaxID=187977 RepID=A0A8F8MZ44_9POTV|nr:polyprotein [Wild potato mosaic virus]
MDSTQAVIMFGSFECKLAQPVVPQMASMAALPQQKPVERAVDPFAALEKSLQPYLERRMFADVRRKKNGMLILKHASAKKVQKLQKLEAARLKELSDFKLGSPSIVSTISIAGGLSVSQMQQEPVAKKPLHTTPSMKRKTSFRKIAMDEAQMQSFIRQLKNIMAEKCGGIELAGKRTTRLKYAKTHLGVKCVCELAHMKGLRKRVDLRLDSEHTAFVKQFARVSSWGDEVNSQMLRRGDSGVILNTNLCRGKFGRSWDSIFIVRGAYEGKIFDARSKLTEVTTLRMVQYSTADRFWRGLESNWKENRKPVEHVCETTYSVEECGEVATLITQALFPCFKLTCGKCAELMATKSKHELCECLSLQTASASELLHEKHPQFKHVEKVLDAISTNLSSVSVGTDNFNEIFRMIGDRVQSPFAHLNALNEFFLRGRQNGPEQWQDAFDALRELARFQKNRTDNIKKGDIAAFRNKLSSKANYNLYLNCDNQLDKNANFLWGQREYHAKRFFTRFFKVIDPVDGYTPFMLRNHPNGARKLAIGNLIVPLDLAEFRSKMRGESTNQPKVGKHCVSMKDGNYVYPCCCTTLDDGSAIESTVYAPTKRHLVIGNTGDTKYVDLPKGETDLLYMAVDGYCYINIFLAMLINVREEEAKDFTKKVRDIFIPKLGKWPSMLDLATTCAQLRIFFPDVHDAELPRILIDHNNQVCHVVDSFGSISSGYHILKASTVSQLILFANDELESDIKHYKVGGWEKFDPNVAQRCSISEFYAMRMLIKGVYRPAVMQQLLMDEPYMLIFSILSPRVLIAMFENDAFEEAARLWVNKSHSVAMIATILNNLARKVSLAGSLTRQLHLISHASEQLLDATCEGFKMNLAYQSALMLLLRTRETSKSNLELITSGYAHQEMELAETLEKSYTDLLLAQWHDLSWREKLLSIWRSRRSRGKLQSTTLGERVQDLRETFSFSPRTLFTEASVRTKASVNRVTGMFSSFVERKCVNISAYCLGSVFNRLPSFKFLFYNVIIFGNLVNIYRNINIIVGETRKSKLKAAQAEHELQADACVELYAALEKKLGKPPTWSEYCEYMGKTNPALLPVFKETYASKEVAHQDSKSDLKKIEHIIAFVSLAVMLFDVERSDCVFKSLNKFKGVIGSLNSDVRHQSLDDIVKDFDERDCVINFEIDDSISPVLNATDVTFGDWWDQQIASGSTIAHYRTEGKFYEFTRATAAKVASDIAMSEHNDFLVRGAVGSGKSTGLPNYLSSMGKVLLIEPTRPLAENVYKQLSGAPFFLKPTMRMRGNSVFGSSPISVMTSGFALHYFAHNVTHLQEIKFVIIDECHVMDASSMAFRSLVHAYHQKCKVLKVSATPPGREVEFTTQFPVKLIVEESLSFKQFVDAQRTGGNADVVQHGVNILVYVASYNEVDMLSKALIEKDFSVTKVDGRTMKHGDLEITTHGTQSKPHFVVATNIIENGVTLDIDVVVDFGLKVVPFLDVDNRSIAYTKTSISYGERIQRLGRVGRIQKGTALRIGSTEKGLVEIPHMISTEAALYCFAYNLPVMSSCVSTALLSKCTLRQVQVMHNFELTPFFTSNFVTHEGTMHPVIHDLLKKYKLRDSIIPLSESAVPYRASSEWLRAIDYTRMGIHLDLPDTVKLAFHTKDIPAALHGKLWDAVNKYKREASFPTLRSASVSKIAYTLSTDLYAIPRTLALIEKLIEDERTKQYQFRSAIDNGCSSAFSIVGIANTLRARYSKDYTTENIKKLEMAKAQLKEFSNLGGTGDETNLIRRFEALQFVHHQSKHALSKALSLEGVWNKSLAARDAIIAVGVACGGAWMLYTWFMGEINGVAHQGRSKSKRIQDLKFRRARDKRSGFEIDNNEDTIEEYFGSAYTKKGKGKGTTVGMGKTSRKFINMYGFEPTEYSFIKFVDPLTGAQLEENVYADIVDIQEKFGEIRRNMILNDELDAQATSGNNVIHAYMIKDWSKEALKVDLTPHNPLKVSDKASAIMKFPERRGELRQTGVGTIVNVDDIPKENVAHEAKSLLKGLRDYNATAQTVCLLTVETEMGQTTTHGIGFGSLLVANHHLFKSFNGTLTVRSHHGTFKVPNLMQLQVQPLKGRDLIVIKMPKDFPVFPQRLHFRAPTQQDRVVLVGSNFQEKYISTTLSETSSTFPVQRSSFWKHWISTDDGNCGLPLVSTVDGYILGLHSLANNRNSENYFAAFDDEFEDKYLRTEEHAQWTRNWKYNPDNVLWGSLKLTKSTPDGMFKTTKMIEDLAAFKIDEVHEQGQSTGWMLEALKDNLQAIAYMKSQLVTKHVVKGECMLFKQYLENNPQAKQFFQPKMWAYGKSLLNKEAYIKDLMKYSKPIEVGIVDCEAFEEATCRVIIYMRQKGFRQCTYVTDEEEIFKALNMNAAVGAMYGGKKKEYFADYSTQDKEQIVKESCRRLYMGDLGIWNGSLKAELRCKEKIAANKTRTFTAAPIDTLLAGKVCVDDFNNQFYSKNIDCCWTVGMTKFYGGWNKLLTALPDNWIYCDADGSQFDSSLTPYLINAVLAVRYAFMEDWDIGFQMLQNLYTEIVYTPISTPDGTIVKKFRGNNSGQPSTVVDNSLMVVLAMHYSFVKANISYDEFDSVCKFFVNGDDLIIAVAPEFEHLLDGLGGHFSDLGLNYDFSSRTRDKTQLWFMSHRGILVEGTYIPKLEEERIVSILQWDRAVLPEHRLEAICAAMIESWGYPELTFEIRRFYQWLLQQEPFSQLADEGKAPYITELALKKLYLNVESSSEEFEAYMKFFAELDDEIECDSFEVRHQAKEEGGTLDAGKEQTKEKAIKPVQASGEAVAKETEEKDVNAGTSGTFSIPRIKAISEKMRQPKANGTSALNLAHLLEYKPSQIDISNARATQSQFNNWFTEVKKAYDVEDHEMGTVLNGLMVWCIENGTSPNVNGVWTMMDGEEQVEFPLKPVVENAKPTFRQIMAHFSDVAEAYIEMRNKSEPYMPRYGLVRNLRDMSLARYAFDFYEITSRTSVRAREIHFQMKAAAVKTAQTRLFGLDGGISTQEENTERHTTEDVAPNLHTMLGVRNM